MLYLKRYRNAFAYRVSRSLGTFNNNKEKNKHVDNNISKYLEIAKELNIEVTPLGYRMFELRDGNITRRIMSDLTLDKENPVSCRLCSNKYLTYKVLTNNGISNLPKYKLYSFKEIQNAINDFSEWNCPIVIKPGSGTHGGTGVTVNIKNIKELKNAIAHSFTYNRKNFLMEQYINGSNFRILTLNGEFLSCCKRIPPRIKGDGRQTIKQLVESENQRRNNDTSEIKLYPIVIDNEVKRKLKSENRTLNTILGENEEYCVKDISNLHSGGEILKIDNVAKEIKKLCKQISDILKIYLAGFDIITDDISMPLDQANGVINEVNTSPGIENMYKANSKIHVVETILKDMFNM